MIRVERFRREWQTDFERLNREWIERYFTIEPEDERVFADPHGEIIDQGGEIFFALDGEVVVGTAALMIHDEGVLELAKMAVTADSQGRGIGRRLMEAAIEHARSRGVRELFLITNSALLPALQLYESVGFERVQDRSDGRFARGDLEMVLRL